MAFSSSNVCFFLQLKTYRRTEYLVVFLVRLYRRRPQCYRRVSRFIVTVRRRHPPPCPRRRSPSPLRHHSVRPRRTTTERTPSTYCASSTSIARAGWLSSVSRWVVEGSAASSVRVIWFRRPLRRPRRGTRPEASPIYPYQDHRPRRRPCRLRGDLKGCRSTSATCVDRPSSVRLLAASQESAVQPRLAPGRHLLGSWSILRRRVALVPPRCRASTRRRASDASPRDAGASHLPRVLTVTMRQRRQNQHLRPSSSAIILQRQQSLRRPEPLRRCRCRRGTAGRTTTRRPRRSRSTPAPSCRRCHRPLSWLTSAHSPAACSVLVVAMVEVVVA